MKKSRKKIKYNNFHEKDRACSVPNDFLEITDGLEAGYMLSISTGPSDEWRPVEKLYYEMLDLCRLDLLSGTPLRYRDAAKWVESPIMACPDGRPCITFKQIVMCLELGAELVDWFTKMAIIRIKKIHTAMLTPLEANHLISTVDFQPAPQPVAL